MHRILLTCVALALVCCVSPAIAQLQPDEILLLVNRNSPDSGALAQFYLKARQLPEGRIIELDLPATDEITFDQYEKSVAPQVRQFLESHALKDKIRCLVSMYGMPLRIGPRTNSPSDAAELKNLREALADATPRLTGQVADLERRATTADSTFHPQGGQAVQALAERIDRAAQAILIAAKRDNDLAQREEKLRELESVLQRFRSPVSTNRSDPATVPSSAPNSAPNNAPNNAPGTAPAGKNVMPTPAARAAELAERLDDPDARRQSRMLSARQGIVRFAYTLETQVEFLSPEDSGAAVDSELALLWWPAYPRSKWVPNPLQFRFARQRVPRTLMTMRLDGPTPQSVRDIIATSLEVERTGLTGEVVIDAGGSGVLDPSHKQQSFAAFDRQFIALADLLKSKTALHIVLDEKTEVLPAGSEKDVAIYTGWYSVGKYVPCCAFSRGAIAYHVASYEMTTLHDPNTHEWCRGVIGDGAAATIGPVAEPYLHAFPLPVEFFPLLLTGKLTLAEAYWRTTPLASWQMCAVGDPLYTPFRTNPAIKVADLPAPLQQIFDANLPAMGR